MITDNQIIRYIFGFKVRHLRLQRGLSLTALSQATGLSTTYLNDIEKGKRYPKPAKINALGDALGVDYNFLVATNASKKLQPIIDLLQSRFLKVFPLEEFGISIEKLLELFTNTPDKVNAFVSTLFKIARNYQVDEERFYLEALRSYQDIHDNHFPELDAAAENFRNMYGADDALPLDTSFLTTQLHDLYGIAIQRGALGTQPLLQRVRSYFQPQQRILHLQDGLSPAQENFLLARELGFQFLGLTDRPLETTILVRNSFDKLLNSYKASHFAAALLMDESQLVPDLLDLAHQPTWQPERLAALLDKYQVTPETLLQRLTNTLPHHLGIHDLFFLRMSTDDGADFSMNKDLHLGQLHNPYNNELKEHYCHRWVSVTTLQDLQQGQQGDTAPPFGEWVIDAQVSHYWRTDRSYLCISIAKPAFRKAERGVSVTLGLLVNAHLRSIFYFLNDPAFKQREVHTTCERCGIEDCAQRQAQPIYVDATDRRAAILEALQAL